MAKINLHSQNIKVDSKKGQSLVEFSMVLVIVLVLMAGAVDLGRAIFAYIAIRDAAQEGAVYGAMYPGQCAKINNRVNASLQDIGAENPNVEVLIDGVACNSAPVESCCAGHIIEVTVSKDDFPITMPFLGGFIGSQTIPLRANASGTILSPHCSG